VKCDNCKHAQPVEHMGECVGYYACALQVMWRFRAVCNIGRHEPVRA